MKKIKLSKRKIKYIIIIFCLVCIIICSSVLIKYFTNTGGMKDLQQIAYSSQTNSDNITDDEKIEIPIDFSTLEKENSDIYSWIKIDDTVIDYPIFRSETEDYYLTHNSKGQKSSFGALYTQSYNSDDFTDFNTIIYGHNMKNGSMFGSLKKYRNRDYFNSHRKITVYLPNKILEYEIFAAYTFDDRHILASFDFSTDEGKSEYIKMIKSKSYSGNYIEQINLTPTDKILTLSTCNSVDTQRFLVQAVLVSEIEVK